MSDQMQCPNCGGHKFKSEKKEIAQKIKFTAPERSRLLYAGWFFIVMGGIMVLTGAPVKNIYSYIGWAGIFFASVGLIILLIRTSKGLKRITGYNFAYTCLTCGYKWKWKKGSPLPKARVHPELKK
jgi:rubredoxin